MEPNDWARLGLSPPPGDDSLVTLVAPETVKQGEEHGCTRGRISQHGGPARYLVVAAGFSLNLTYFNK